MVYLVAGYLESVSRSKVAKQIGETLRLEVGDRALVWIRMDCVCVDVHRP
jgi:hypothetical protein